MASKFDFTAFGKKIKIKRTIDEDITLRELTEITGVGFATISRVENGKTIEIDHIIALSDWLEVSLCDFIVTSKPKALAFVNGTLTATKKKEKKFLKHHPSLKK